MSTVVAVAQIVAAVAAVLAATAAWRSANTSARTARRADATSARAVEALGRATMPRLTLQFYEGDNEQFSPGPVAARLDVVNEGDNPGLIRAVSASRSDGVRLGERFARPIVIGTPSDFRSERRDRMFRLGALPRVFPDPTAGQPDGVPFELVAPEPLVLEVEFADVAGLVWWRLRDRVLEHVQRVEGGDPIWGYSLAGRPELDIISDLGRVDDREVGWVRRLWRRFW